jgi:hypothetical protein
MRTVISREDPFLSWVRSDPPSKEIIGVLHACKDDALLCVSNGKKPIKNLALASKSDRQVELLLSLINDLPMARCENPNRFEDVSLQGREFSTLLDLLSSEEYLASVQHRRKTLQVNEKREEGFRRKFGGLLALCSEIEFVDPYFGEKILKRDNVASWLLRSVKNESACSIRIITQMPMPAEGNWSGFSSRQKLTGMVQALSSLQSELNTDSKIYFDVYDEMPHNRYLKMKFSDGFVICNIDHGVDAFKSDPFTELEPIAQITAEDFNNNKNSPKWTPRWNELHESNQSFRAADKTLVIRVTRGLAT